MVKYFRDFSEFQDDHENFCHDIMVAQSTELDALKSQTIKLIKSPNFKATKIWSYTANTELFTVKTINWKNLNSFHAYE